MPLNNNFNNSNPDNSFKSMPRSQKIAVISLSFVGVAIIFFGFLQFKTRVNSPFQYDGELTSTSSLSSLNLMDLDTDKDGLSDYDEANIYQTSRYVQDSDSDGILDNEEVNNGTDPNCAVGENCFAGQDLLIPKDTSSTTMEIPDSLGEISIATSTNESELRSALSGEVDIITLRKLLIESGASEETLNQISDEDLLKSYQEVLNK